MRYRILGRTGMKVSVLGCGTNALAGVSQEQANIVLNYALDKGINVVETGSKRTYGIIEEMVGNAISDRRDEIWLFNKSVELTAKEILRDVDQSLASLRTDHIDLYQLGNIRFPHQLDRCLAPNGALQGLIRAQRQGKVTFIGITSHAPDILMKALEAYPFDNVQFLLNMANPYALEELIPYAKRNGIGTVSMQPTGHGFLKPASKAFRFSFCSGVDIVLSGMYSMGTIDENVTYSDPEPSGAEWEGLFREMRELPSTGCRQCGACTPCPQEIGISTIMTFLHYRAKYGLLPQGERSFKDQAKRASLCDECGECERRCPYRLSIIPMVKMAAKTV
ncbi:MAG: aldo/keto reductase [Candidatus Bathyarchaeia archaeon]